MSEGINPRFSSGFHRHVAHLNTHTHTNAHINPNTQKTPILGELPRIYNRVP